MANIVRINILMISLLIFQNQAAATDKEISLSYEDVWKRTLQAVTLNGIELTMNDKELGILQGEKTSDQHSEYFTCPKLGGRTKSHVLKLSAIVREKDEISTMVSIQVSAIRKSFRNKKFIFITVGRVHDESICETTGALEEAILKSLSL